MHATPEPPSETLPVEIVPVNSLVAFVLQEGDLTPGVFQMRDRAQAGTQGHKRLQRSRPEGYQTEVAVAFRLGGEEPPLEVRGRIDGLYADQEPVILEEIKTTTLPLEAISEGHNPLHWAQAQCYAFMLAHQEGLTAVRVHLTYYQLDSRAEKTFERDFSTAELESFFFGLVTAYLAWFRKVRARQAQRDQSIKALDFPYVDYRPGQREMAVAVYKAIRDGERLYVQAPTGVGKTIAALFPAVKAVGLGLADK
ncbi:MAG: PD-(D/E)XK nuclease family protein, partial [Anaerolineales bacterium]|nr:PD-(D/E)XK nuclease family protein [Anaerolineales bacterium]